MFSLNFVSVLVSFLSVKMVLIDGFIVLVLIVRIWFCFIVFIFLVSGLLFRNLCFIVILFVGK